MVKRKVSVIMYNGVIFIVNEIHGGKWLYVLWESFLFLRRKAWREGAKEAVCVRTKLFIFEFGKNYPSGESLASTLSKKFKCW